MMPPAPVVSNSHSEIMSVKLLKDSWKTPWSINSVSARDHDARGECDYGAGLRVGLGQALPDCTRARASASASATGSGNGDRTSATGTAPSATSGPTHWQVDQRNLNSKPESCSDPSRTMNPARPVTPRVRRRVRVTSDLTYSLRRRT